MPSVNQLISDIDIRLPNTFTTAQKVSWMNDAQNEAWRFLATTELYEFDTVASQALYAMASDMKFDMIKSVMVSNSTTIDGTEGYAEYEYAGMDDEMSGNHYYDALGTLGIYPTPTSDGAGYNVKVYYESSPVQLSTDTLTTIPSINSEYHDILKFRCMKVIAQSGNNPDVELANNYQREEDAIMAKIRRNYYSRKARKPRDTYRRSDGWYNG